VPRRHSPALDGARGRSPQNPSLLVAVAFGAARHAQFAERRGPPRSRMTGHTAAPGGRSPARAPRVCAIVLGGLRSGVVPGLPLRRAVSRCWRRSQGAARTSRPRARSPAAGPSFARRARRRRPRPRLTLRLSPSLPRLGSRQDPAGAPRASSPAARRPEVGAAVPVPRSPTAREKCDPRYRRGRASPIDADGRSPGRLRGILEQPSRAKPARRNSRGRSRPERLCGRRTRVAQPRRARPCGDRAGGSLRSRWPRLNRPAPALALGAAAASPARACRLSRPDGPAVPRRSPAAPGALPMAKEPRESRRPPRRLTCRRTKPPAPDQLRRGRLASSLAVSNGSTTMIEELAGARRSIAARRRGARARAEQMPNSRRTSCGRARGRSQPAPAGILAILRRRAPTTLCAALPRAGAARWSHPPAAHELVPGNVRRETAVRITVKFFLFVASHHQRNNLFFFPFCAYEGPLRQSQT